MLEKLDRLLGELFGLQVCDQCLDEWSLAERRGHLFHAALFAFLVRAGAHGSHLFEEVQQLTELPFDDQGSNDSSHEDR